jgi:hypothetical protein
LRVYSGLPVITGDEDMPEPGALHSEGRGQGKRGARLGRITERQAYESSAVKETDVLEILVFIPPRKAVEIGKEVIEHALVQGLKNGR